MTPDDQGGYPGLAALRWHDTDCCCASLHLEQIQVTSPSAYSHLTCAFIRYHLQPQSPVYDCLEVCVALLGDVRVARGGLLLPRELLPHSAARDNRHHQLGLAEPHLHVPSATKHQSMKQMLSCQRVFL